MEDVVVNQLPIQWGFAGFSVVLLGILVMGGKWLITKFLDALTEWNKVIQVMVKAVDNNTQAVSNLEAKLAERPCLLQGEEYITAILDRFMNHPISPTTEVTAPEAMTREEVQAELKKRNINVTQAVERVHQAVAAAKMKETTRAKESRGTRSQEAKTPEENLASQKEAVGSAPTPPYQRPH